MNRRTAIVLLAAATAQRPFVAAAQSAPYKIGATMPLTGPIATLIANMRIGAEVAQDEINKAGGVGGHPLQLVFEDSQGTPEGGIAAMRKLAQIDGVQAMISISTNVVTAQMPLADSLKVATLCTIESPGLVTKSQYVFAHSPTAALQEPILRAFWQKSKIRHVYAFYSNNAYGQLVAPFIRRAAGDAGAAYDEALVDVTLTDYRGIVTKAKDAGADALMVAMQGAASEGAIVRTARELGIAAPAFDSGNYYNDTQWRAAIGSAIDGMYLCGPNIDATAGATFVKEYTARAGHPPAYTAALLYDIMKMYAFAIGKAGYNGEAIRDQIANLKTVPSVFGGTIEMAANHYTVSSALSLWQVRGERLVKIS